jgi:membrane protease YdiL (CAAX protease family)
VGLRREDGSVRPGWAVLLFAALVGVAVPVELGLSAALYGSMRPGLRLGDPAGALLTSVRAVWLALATWVSCWAVGWRFGDAYLRDARWAARLGQGIVLGTAALGLAVLVPLALGHEHFSPSPSGAADLASSLGWSALTCAGIALSEEMLVRGFALRQLERRRGRAVAALVTAGVFGLLHVLNPHASWLAVANIILVGLWLALAVQRTGSLWMAVGIHFAWNLAQAFAWGEPVSGFPVRASLLARAPPGDALWTGGSFGPEASLPTAVVLAALVMLTAGTRATARSPAPADPCARSDSPPGSDLPAGPAPGPEAAPPGPP